MENIHNNDNDGGEQEAQAEQQIAHHHQRQRQRKQERQRKFKKVNTILEKHGKFPVQNRNSIDELVDNFLEQVGNSIHDLLCNNDADADNYRGLDSDRDTEAEVETAIRFFPEVLSRREDRFDEYPIQLLTCLYGAEDYRCNLKAVSFIPIVARLAVEFSMFEENERGGLLVVEHEYNNNILQRLISSCHDIPDIEHNELVDDKYLQVLIHLRKLGLFKKEDIQRYELLIRLCGQKNCFAKKRFHFLSQLDPNALIRTDSDRYLPLHLAAFNPMASIQVFEGVFKAGICFFPKKKGISMLFQKNRPGSIPFVGACDRYGRKYASKSKGRDAVIEVIESTLSNCSDKPDSFVDAFLSAAIDEDVSLDCVYFLLRRDPDMLQKLLQAEGQRVRVKSTGRLGRCIGDIDISCSIGDPSGNGKYPVLLDRTTSADADDDNNDSLFQEIARDEIDFICNKCTSAVADHRCGRCKKVWYCGRECQSKDWKKHKRNCNTSATSS